MKRRILALLLAVSVLVLSGCGPAVSLTELPEPAESVEEFFTCLNNENYDGVDALVYNYTTLGMEKVTADVSDSDILVDKMLYDVLLASRRYKIQETGEPVGREAAVKLSFTTFDYRKMTEPLEKRVTAAVKNAAYRGEVFVSESDVSPVILSELQQLVEQSASDLMTTQSFELTLKYHEKKWRIVVSDEFYNALIGYLL